MLSWGDVGMYLITPGGGLGAAAVQAAGSAEQKGQVPGAFLPVRNRLLLPCA